MGTIISGAAVNRGAADRMSFGPERLVSPAPATGHKGRGCTTVKAGLIRLMTVFIVSRR